MMFFCRNVKWGPRGLAVTPFPTLPCGKERSARRAKPAPSRHVTPRHATTQPGHASELFRRSRPGGRVGRRRAVQNTTSAIQIRWWADRPPAGEPPVQSVMPRQQPNTAVPGGREEQRAGPQPAPGRQPRHAMSRRGHAQIRTDSDQNKERIYSASAAPLRRIPAPRSGRMGAFLFPS